MSSVLRGSAPGSPSVSSRNSVHYNLNAVIEGDNISEFSRILGQNMQGILLQGMNQMLQLILQQHSM